MDHSLYRTVEKVNAKLESFCNHGESTVDYPQKSKSSQASVDAV
jgi:hypothetical protein